MNNKYYDDEDRKFSGIIETLKSLPHINAPSDFDINLKRKLNNLKYPEKKENKYFFFFRRPFIPATALIFSIIVVLFIVFRPESAIDDPFMYMPELKAEYSSTINTNSVKNLLIDPINITSNDVVIKKAPVSSPAVNEFKKPAIKKNSAGIASENNMDIREFLSASEGHNVDRSLRAKPQLNVSRQGNNGKYVSFDGFNLVNEENDFMLNQLKARMDSLKKSMRGNR